MVACHSCGLPVATISTMCVTSFVNCSELWFHVTTSGDHLYEDSLILIVQFSNQAVRGGLYRWYQVSCSK